MDRKQSQAIETFFLSLLGFVLVVGAAVAIIFPEIEVNFRGFEPIALESPAPVMGPPQPRLAVATEMAAPEKGQPTVASPPSAVSGRGRNRAPSRAQRRGQDVANNASQSSGSSGIEKAVSLVDSGKWQEAEKMLLEILKDDPRNESALVELTMINLLDKKNPDAALPYLEKSLKVNAENESLISELLIIFDEKGTPDKAVDFLKQLAAEQGENPSIDYGMAQALLRSGRQAEAVDYLEKSVEHREGWDKDEVLEQLGDTYADLGMPDQALDSWRRSMERQRRHIDSFPEDREYMMEQYTGTRLKYASALMEAGRFDEVDNILTELEKDLPDDEWIASLRRSLSKKRL